VQWKPSILKKSFKKNMANKLKTSIRLKKVAQRLAKPIYPKDPNICALIKAEEKMNLLDKASSDTWKIMYSRGFIPNVDNSNPDFFEDFKMLADFSKEVEKLSKRIERLEKKSGISIEQAQIIFKDLNSGRMSQSF
jgi:hypothetical protein